ncbi:MAG: D-2-hydroxyacid dehydrogenase [Oscillospiraceae bacterium]
MKLVILDSYALRENDLDWQSLYSLVDEVVSYPRTAYSDIVSRLNGADFAILNKCRIDDAVLCAVPTLKWIGVTATGTDNLDIAACRRHNVAVANVPGYSTHSVAQLVFALLGDVCQCPARHEAALRKGHWQLNVPKRFAITSQTELYGKTFGIIGYGDIGKQVAKIALAFGMKLLCYTRAVKSEYLSDDISFVSLDILLQHSDIITLHCPLTEKTRGIINSENLAKMKKNAILINTARGALVDEDAIASALNQNTLGAYAADVFCTEPLNMDNSLLSVRGAFLTPHIAWATNEALSRLAAAVSDNLASFLQNTPKNIVN